MSDYEEALSLLSTMTRAVRFEFQMNTQHWPSGMATIDNWCKANLSNPVRVMLTREDDLTDTAAWYVIFCQQVDLLPLLARWPLATYRIPESTQEDTDPTPVPEWLKEFSEKAKH